MLGIGFIPLIMAYEYIKNRDKYSKTKVGTALGYLLGLPILCYDYYVLGDGTGFIFTMGEGFFSWSYRTMMFAFGMSLLYMGLEEIYIFLKQVIHKVTIMLIY